MPQLLLLFGIIVYYYHLKAAEMTGQLQVMELATLYFR